MYGLVDRVLKSLGHTKYKDNFIQEKITDNVLRQALSTNFINFVLKGVIHNDTHREEFLQELKKVVASEDTQDHHVTGSEVEASVENFLQNNLDLSQASGLIAVDLYHKIPDSHEPQPLQIMDFVPGSKGQLSVGLNEKVLASILRNTGNRPVAIFVIAGPTRRGKSFFLNFVLRHLNAKIKNDTDWIGRSRDSDPLLGFSWRSSYERVTSGLWMWSEPFTLTSEKDGTEYDLLLMDTQGVFDEKTGQREWSILMGLSLLCSSCLVFNLNTNVDENDLQLLNSFLSFGLMAMEDKHFEGSEYPFQKLVFLIRDWNNPGQFPYGSEGGNDFIEMLLSPKKSHQNDQIAVRENLKKCFQEISCFLLPHPGPDVLKPNYNGSIGVCKDFADEVEKTITKLFDKSEFPRMKINGNYLTGEDVLHQFKLYAKLFNDLETVGSVSIYHATVQACNRAVINKCISSCKDVIEKRLEQFPLILSEDLDIYFKQEKKRALTQFQNSRTMGSQGVINDAEDELGKLLEVAFLEIKTTYKPRCDKKISEIQNETTLKYATTMQELLPTGEKEFLNEDILQTISRQATTIAKEWFQSKFHITSSSDLKTETEQVDKLIEDIFTEFKEKNKAKQHAAENLMSSKINQFVTKYREHMDAKIGNRIVDQTKLDKYHKKVYPELEGEFTRTQSASPLFSVAKESLIQEISTARNNYKELMTTAIQNMTMMGENLLAKALTFYQEKMMEVGSTPEEFKVKHPLVKESAMLILKDPGSIPIPEILNTFCLTLESQINDVFFTLLSELLENKSDLKIQMVKITDKARKHYEQSMQDFMSTNPDPFDQVKFEEQNNQARADSKIFFAKLLQELDPSIKVTQEQMLYSIEELENAIASLFARLMRRNEERKIQLNEQMEQAIEAFMKQYIQAMKSQISGEVTSVERVQEYHDTVSKKSMQDFSAVCSTSPLFEKGKVIFGSKLSEEKENFLQSMKDQIEKTLHDGEVHISEVIKMYKNKMESLVEYEEEKFERAHALYKQAAKDQLQNSVQLLTSTYQQRFLAQLEKHIQELYSSLKSALIHKKEKKERDVQEASASALKIYLESMNNIFEIQQEPFSEVQLSQRHIHYESEATNFLKQFYLTTNESPDLVKIALTELGKEINSLYAEFQSQNRQREKKVKHEFEMGLQVAVELYRQEMNPHIENEVFSDAQLERLHNEVSHKLESSYANDNSKSPLLTIGRKSIREKINQELKNLEVKVKTKRGQILSEANSLLLRALNSYKDDMGKVIGHDDDVFEDTHRRSASASKELLSSSRIDSKDIKEQVVQSLESQINAAYTELQKVHSKFKAQVGKDLEIAKQEAMKIYNEGIQTVFIQCDGSLSDVQLNEQQNHNRNKATSFLEAAHERIKTHSKDAQNLKASSLAELTTLMEGMYAQLKETNSNRRKDAERQMEAEVTRCHDQYKLDMAFQFNGQVVLPEKVLEAHDVVYNKCLDKFKKLNSSSIFFADGKARLGKKLLTERDAIQKTMALEMNHLNTEGEKGIEDAMTYYKDKMSKVNQTNEAALDVSHNLVKDIALDVIKKSDKIPNGHFKAWFLAKLESQIEDFYNQLLNSYLNSQEQIQKRIEEMKKSTAITYDENMRKSFPSTNEHVEEDKFELQHAKEKKEGKIRLRNFFKSLPKSVENIQKQEDKAVAEVASKIDQLYSELKRLNESKKQETKARVEDDVSCVVQYYSFEMESLIKGRIVPDEDFKAFHDQVFQDCFSKFSENRSGSSLSLVNEAKRILTSKISIERAKLEKDMADKKQNLNLAGKNLVEEALASYNENMEKIVGKDSSFTEGHAMFKKSSLDLISKSTLFPNGESRGQFLSQLESKINDSHAKFIAVHIKTKYEEKFESLFQKNDDPISELTLKQLSQDQSEKCIKELKDLYKDKKKGSKNLNDEEQEALQDLRKHMDSMYADFVEINRLRKTNYEARTNTILSNAKQTYSQKLKAIAEVTFDEDDFTKKELELHKEIEKDLEDKLKRIGADKNCISQLMKELQDSLAEQFKINLNNFVSRQKGDAIAVKATLYQASRYYNEEMEKRIKLKDWFETEELSQLNDKLTAESIRKCKEDVPLTEAQEKQLLDAMKGVYLKFVDENQLKRPVENPAIGIDLGTTYSCVAVYLNGSVKIIPVREFSDSSTMASYVTFKNDHSIDVGDASKKQAFLNPANTIFDAKRLIGRTFDDPIVQKDMKLWPFTVVGENNQPKIQVRGKNYRPEEISSKILVKIKQVAEQYLMKEVKQAVVTVPAYFNDGQRQATRDAAEIAGLKVKILNEPTAAAIAYKLHRTDELKRNVLIFDLGGGTFDVAVLEMKGKDIKVKATLGDTHLGGEDFDNKMVDSILKRVKEKFNIDLARERDSSDTFKKSKASERLRRIRDQCEGAKRILSSAQSTEIVINMLDDNFDLVEEFTREEFEDINMPQFEECINVVRRALEDAKLDKTDVDDIVLVGGSTRIPKVQELLKEFFEGKKELNCTINADEAVAVGAAMHAALMNNEQCSSIGGEVTLSDVAPLSVGIEVATGELSVVIPKNTPVPCVHTHEFRTSQDNQTTADIKIYEGEKKMAVDNNFLGKFLLKGIPRAPARTELIDCTMDIDEEGILHVTAASRSTGTKGDIVIESFNGRMSKAEIENAKKSDPFKW